MAATALDAAGATADSATATYAVGAASNRLLVVTNAQKNNLIAALTASYGGQSMTEQEEQWIEGGGNDVQVTTWTLDEAGIAAAGTTTITIAGGELNTSENYIIARSYQDVDQSTPVPETNPAGTASSTPNPQTGADIVAGDGSVVHSVSLVGQGSQTASWGADLTERIDTNSSGSSGVSMADAEVATGQTIECRCTWSTQNRAAQVSIEIAPAAAAAGKPFMYYQNQRRRAV